jgi:hypothetical protein
MSFPWLHPKRTPPRGRKEMYRREIEERAALLHRLGYSRARAAARLKSNVAWDFEIGGGGDAPAAGEIDAAVAAVYQRGGARGGAPTV